MHKDNITLIGMPAVGKSTIGILLAKILGYQFIDSDLLIQNREKMLLKDIIARDGIDGFIAIEDSVNASIQTTGSIIATGGSAVYGENAMKHLKETSTVLYLSINFDALSKRLADVKNRGVVIRDGQSLKDLYEERCTLYKKYADITVDVSDIGIEETIEEIQKVL